MRQEVSGVSTKAIPAGQVPSSGGGIRIRNYLTSGRGVEISSSVR